MRLSRQEFSKDTDKKFVPPECCSNCKWARGPCSMPLACAHEGSEFYPGPVMPDGWCSEFEPPKAQQ